VPRTKTSTVYSKLVGREIRESRLTAKLTQAALARRLDVSASYIANVEAGRANLTVGQLSAIAAALGAALMIKLPLIERELVTGSAAHAETGALISSP
jgi:transcriptional regulator with XRE-family HTH domain